MPIADIKPFDYSISEFSARIHSGHPELESKLRLRIRIDDDATDFCSLGVELHAIFMQAAGANDVRLKAECRIPSTEEQQKKELNQRLGVVNLIGICRGVIAQNTSLFPGGACWLPPINIVEQLRKAQTDRKAEDSFSLLEIE